ncbi:MAG: hypothetical protein PHI63_05935 [Patescibacteria group bacterium]|nr:hypothetical protein [Patescibacteria group bacterium]
MAVINAMKKTRKRLETGSYGPDMVIIDKKTYKKIRKMYGGTVSDHV